jgi:dipeptide/tripeptide permease
MSATADKTSQPTGLYVLFFAEAWERFSYYGMRALLVLYMVNHLKFAKNDALSVYGAYTALVYLTPLLGGIVADRLFGQRRTVVVGGVLMAIGHFIMAFEGWFFIALLFLIVGNGAFKPNISTQVGNLYREGDAPPRRRASPSSTWASTSAPSSPTSCAARSAERTAGTTASAPRASAWSPAWACSSGARSSSVTSACPRRRQPR